jgi:hypothetical protein
VGVDDRVDEGVLLGESPSWLPVPAMPPATRGGILHAPESQYSLPLGLHNGEQAHSQENCGNGEGAAAPLMALDETRE